MGRKARFNADNIIGVIFTVGVGKYRIVQNPDYITKVDLIDLNMEKDNKNSIISPWGSKAQAAANLNCNSWVAIEEPELYQIF
jgi:hypothetical protein